MNQIADYLSGIALIISGVTLVAKASKEFFKLFKEEPEEHKVKLTSSSKWILLFLIMIFAASSTYFAIKYLKETKFTRIALLIPIDNSKSSAPYIDGEHQAFGLLNLLKSKLDITQKYHFLIYNHKMDFDTAKSIIEKELNRGTEYFVCTMSDISEKLSLCFDSLCTAVNSNIDPKLILTVASSPAIETKKNRVYRFYIRSQEEAKILAHSQYIDTSFYNAIYFAVDDNYGRGAVNEFTYSWTSNNKIDRAMVGGIYFDKLLDPRDVKDSISRFLSLKKNRNIDLVFIAHYGSGLDHIISGLKEFNSKIPIVATSTLSIKRWQEPVKDYLNKIDWITCLPSYNKAMEPEDKDVVRDFVYYTLDRLTEVLNRCDNHNIDFHSSWSVSPEPKRIVYHLDHREGDSDINEGDAIIELKEIVNKKIICDEKSR